MVVVVVRAFVRVVNMIVAEVLYIRVYLVVRMEEVVIFVKFYLCWLLCGAIGCDGAILVVMAVVRVTLLI